MTQTTNSVTFSSPTVTPSESHLVSHHPTAFNNLTVSSRASSNPTVSTAVSNTPTVTSGPSNHRTALTFSNPTVSTAASNNPTATSVPSDHRTALTFSNPTVGSGASDNSTASPATFTDQTVWSVPSNNPTNCVASCYQTVGHVACNIPPFQFCPYCPTVQPAFNGQTVGPIAFSSPGVNCVAPNGQIVNPPVNINLTVCPMAYNYPTAQHCPYCPNVQPGSICPFVSPAAFNNQTINSVVSNSQTVNPMPYNNPTLHVYCHNYPAPQLVSNYPVRPAGLNNPMVSSVAFNLTCWPMIFNNQSVNFVPSNHQIPNPMPFNNPIVNPVASNNQAVITEEEDTSESSQPASFPSSTQYRVNQQSSINASIRNALRRMEALSISVTEAPTDDEDSDEATN